MNGTREKRAAVKDQPGMRYERVRMPVIDFDLASGQGVSIIDFALSGMDTGIIGF